jgi:hypothetical protein
MMIGTLNLTSLRLQRPSVHIFVKSKVNMFTRDPANLAWLNRPAETIMMATGPIQGTSTVQKHRRPRIDKNQ